LTKEHEKKPWDTRVVFYLAQTLDLIDDLQPALDMYQKRIDMGGWQQEIFEAHMRRVSIRGMEQRIQTCRPPKYTQAVSMTFLVLVHSSGLKKKLC